MCLHKRISLLYMTVNRNEGGREKSNATTVFMSLFFLSGGRHSSSIAGEERQAGVGGVSGGSFAWKTWFTVTGEIRQWRPGGGEILPYFSRRIHRWFLKPGLCVCVATTPLVERTEYWQLSSKCYSKCGKDVCGGGCLTTESVAVKRGRLANLQ